jgi:hypothetical protein
LLGEGFDRRVDPKTSDRRKAEVAAKNPVPDEEELGA